MRPADGWAFVEPKSCDTGIVTAVGYGLDICDVGKEAIIGEDKTIKIEALGVLVTKFSNLTIVERESNGNNHR